MRSIYVARHGQSTWNAERRWAGHGDPPLTELGREQAREASARFAALGFDRVASSALVRATETASILAEALGLPRVAPNPLFDERFAGPMSGMTSEEIEARWPGLLAGWRSGEEIEIPGGEPWSDFVERIVGGLALLQREPQRTLLVAHMGVQRAIESSLGRPLERYANLEGFWAGDEVRGPSA